MILSKHCARAVLAAALLVGSLGSPTLAQNAPKRGATPVLRVGGAFFALSVANMDSSARWYSEKLGLSVVMRTPRTNTPGATVLEGGGLIVKLVERPDAVSLAAAAPAIRETSRIHGIFKAGSSSTTSTAPSHNSERAAWTSRWVHSRRGTTSGRT